MPARGGAVYFRSPLRRHAASQVNDFELVKVLGKGSFGKVFLVRKKGGLDDSAVYAMKTLRKEILLRRNQIEHTKSERSILQTVNHPFIVALRYAFQTKEKLYIVTGESCTPRAPFRGGVWHGGVDWWSACPHDADAR
jgi:serine/threonine protein kinase